MNPTKVAVIQAAAIPDNSVASAHKAAQLIAQATAEGAKVLVFPEAFLGGYPKGHSFGCPIGMRLPEGRDAYATYYEQAIHLDGEEINIIAAALTGTDAVVVMGCIEIDLGTLYCTALTFEGDKGLIAKHRKLMPTGGERLIWGFGDGATMPVIDTSYGRIASVICWENYMPMLRMYLYSQGVTIYCAPTADDRDTWLASMRHVALEGRCYVLTACQYLKRDAYPADFECALGDAPDTLLMRGGSAIIDPLGTVLAGPNYSEEAILYAQLDPSQIIRGKFDFDVSGHYARPDIFQLHVDTRPKQAVISSHQTRSAFGVEEP